MNTKKGFSLTELVVVAGIIALLFGVVLPSLSRPKAEAQNIKRLSEMRELSKALESYYQDNGSYPSCGEAGWCGGECDGSDQNEFITALTPLVDASILGAVPQDPLNQGCYVYSYWTSDSSTTEECGGERLNRFQYVLRVSLENREVGWDEYSEDISEGNEYCLTGVRRP